MTEIKIKVPNSIRKILKEIDEPLYVEAIKSVAKKKLVKKRRELNALRKKLSRYESKYSIAYEEFRRNVPDSRAGHDDWIEWTYLQESYSELSSTIDKLNMLLKN